MPEPIVFTAKPQELVECEYYSMTPIDAAAAVMLTLHIAMADVRSFGTLTNDKARIYVQLLMKHRDPTDPSRVIIRRFKTPSGNWFYGPLADDEVPINVTRLILKHKVDGKFVPVRGDPNREYVLKRTYNGVMEVIFDPRKDDPYVAESGTEIQPSTDVPV